MSFAALAVLMWVRYRMRVLASVGVTLAFGALIPAAGLLAFRSAGLVDSLEVGRRDQRILPLVLAVGAYLAGSAVLALISARPELVNFMLIFALNTALIAVITVFWKISIHTAAFAASVVAFSLIVSLHLLWLLLLIGPLAWSRVSLRRHTGVQTIAGGILGAVSTALQYGLYPA